MSSADLQQLLTLIPTLTTEQLHLLRERVDAASATSTGDQLPVDPDERLQRRLLALGLVGEIKPPPKPAARAFTPIAISGEPLSAMVLRERR